MAKQAIVAAVASTTACAESTLPEHVQASCIVHLSSDGVESDETQSQHGCEDDDDAKGINEEAIRLVTGNNN